MSDGQQAAKSCPPATAQKYTEFVRGMDSRVSVAQNGTKDANDSTDEQAFNARQD
jgi:hypothetical protein